MNRRSFLLLVTACAPGAFGQCDPTQTGVVLASDGAADHLFGQSLCIRGDLAIIGANRATHAGGYHAGAAYIFERIDGGWFETARLTAPDAQVEDRFGWSVGIDGGIAVIGAPWDDDAGVGAGSAYVFENIGGVWTQTAKLFPLDAAAGDRFATAAAISGGTIVVGAYRHDGAGPDSGAAYIYENIGGIWSQTAVLAPDDAAADDWFGWAVGIDGDAIIIGAHLEDDAGADSGAAYIFENSGGAWSQSAKLSAPDGEPGDWFGWAVAIDGPAAVVGAHLDDDAGQDSGSAYVFENSGGVWSHSAKLAASDGQAGDAFGKALAIDDGVIVVGAEQDDDAGADSGSAYLFYQLAGEWTAQDKLTASDAAAGDLFGAAASVRGQTALIGAPLDSDQGAASGSAYFFDLACSCWPDFNGDGVVNSQDFIAFLNAFTSGDPSADFNRDGTLNSQDFIAFLNAFVRGC